VALPHEEEIKAYLRVTTNVEDDLFEQLRMSAEAWVRAYYNVPLGSTSRTFRGLWPKVGMQRERDTRLVVPVRPCSATVTLTDADDDAVDSSTYTVDERTGYIDANRFESFGNPPYTAVVSVGWEEHPDYDDDVEPVLRQAILWAASTYYRNRNVAAIYEQSGGQVSITYTEEEIPPLLRSLMKGLKDPAWFA
jgi:hypothetical protein